MSADSEDSTPEMIKQLGQDAEGREVLAMPYDEQLAQKAVEQGLAKKTGVVNDSVDDADNEGSTPGPKNRANTRARDQGGPVRRFNDVFTDLGSVQLEAMGLDGYEIASSAATIRNEMYRSQFPVINERFVVKGVDSGYEYDEEVPFDIRAAREEMMADGHRDPPSDPEAIPEEYTDHPVRRPDPSERLEAERYAESVNREGQSLRELFKYLEDDQSRLGVSVLVVRKNYVVAVGDTAGYERGEVITESPDELVRGDPKRIVPVSDEDGRVGGFRWACPVHRDDEWVKNSEYEQGDRVCPECGADYREVYFVETGGAGKTRSSEIEKVYFQDEVITWARYYPRMHGLDGLSPVHHVWLKQAVLHWMDIYGAAFYDPESERYPNKFMVVHTTNPQAWERNFEKAEDEAKENPYSSQILMNQYSGESNTTPEVQVIDLMSDDLLGQDEQIKKRYKQDIRSHFGVTNVFDSDIEDAGGLNNEGLQMEVTDRDVATAMHDTTAGPLDELSKVLGIEDYQFGFIPEQGTEAADLKTEIDAGAKAAKNGLTARMEDGQVRVEDGEFDPDAGEEEGEGGGLGALFGAEDPGTPEVTMKADPMANGHQMDPGTGECECGSTGEVFQVETVGGLEGDCPHCGEPLSHLGSKAKKYINDLSGLSEGRSIEVGPRGGVYYNTDGDSGTVSATVESVNEQNGTVTVSDSMGVQRTLDVTDGTDDGDGSGGGSVPDSRPEPGEPVRTTPDEIRSAYGGTEEDPVIDRDLVVDAFEYEDWDICEGGLRCATAATGEGSGEVYQQIWDAVQDAAEFEWIPEDSSWVVEDEHRDEAAEAFADAVLSETPARQPTAGEVDQKAVGDDGYSAGLRTFRVVPHEDDDTDYDEDVLGVGTSFPESGCYVEWNRTAFPDALEEPHVSEYGSVADLQKATGNRVVDYTTPPGEAAPDSPPTEVAEPGADGGGPGN